MGKAKIADKKPKMVDLEKEKTYAWCSCGESSNQPWCDGSHKGGDFKPVLFKAEENTKSAMCMCKQTKNPPYCDGEHRFIG